MSTIPRTPRAPARLFRVPGGPALLAALSSLPLAPGAAPGAAQEEAERGWLYNAELTFVLTAGNAQSSTLGAGVGVRRVAATGEFKLEAGGIRTESSTTTRTARGTPEDFEVIEESDSELTAENYVVRGRYDRQLSERLFLFGGAGWERNTFAGFDGRYSFAGGSGVSWLDRPGHRLKTDIGLTYTIQDDVIEDPTSPNEFPGLRFSLEYLKSLTETADFTSTLVVDDNLDNTEDLRADFTNAVTLSISEALSFRTSFQLLFDNLPSLTTVPLLAPDGTPTGETVLVQLEEIDTRFRFALVVDF